MFNLKDVKMKPKLIGLFLAEGIIPTRYDPRLKDIMADNDWYDIFK